MRRATLSHNFRRGLCCDDDGTLLLAFSKDLKELSQYLMPLSKKEVLLLINYKK